MNNRWAIVGAMFIVAVMIAACIVATLKIDLTPKQQEKPGKRPPRTHELGQGIRISKHGLYGVNLVSIGRAHLRKLRKGPFTIGAINELVLDDVALVLPEDVWKGEEKAKGEGQGQERTDSTPQTLQTSQTPQTLQTPQPPQTGPSAMLSKLGINAGTLKMGGQMPRFSALAIRGLKVARLEGTNAVPWFIAERAEARTKGLHMRNGWSTEGGEERAWHEAFLVFEPRLTLFTGR